MARSRKLVEITIDVEWFSTKAGILSASTLVMRNQAAVDSKPAFAMKRTRRSVNCTMLEVVFLSGTGMF